MKRMRTWIGCSMLAVGLMVLPAAAQDQPDLSGPPMEQGPGNHEGPGGGRQFNGDRAQRPGDRLMEVVQQLNLTDEQKAKVREILKANAGTMAENRKAMKAAMEQLRAAMESKDQEKIKAARENVKQLREGDREKVVAQVSAVLTDEQKAKLKELLKEERPGGPEGRRDGALEKLQADLAKLNLTDDQKTQIHELVKAHREAMEKFMTEHKDQIEQLRQKVQDAMQTKDREAAQAAREEMRKLMEGAPVKPKDLIEQISKVLTEDQARQLKQMIRQQRQGEGPGGRAGEMGGPRGRGPGGPEGENGGNPPPPPPADQLDL